MRECRSESIWITLWGKVLICKVCSHEGASNQMAGALTVDVLNMVLKSFKNRMMTFITMMMRLILVPIHQKTTTHLLLWRRGVKSWLTVTLLMIFQQRQFFIRRVMFDITLQQNKWLNMIRSIVLHILSTPKNVKAPFPDNVVKGHNLKKFKTKRKVHSGKVSDEGWCCSASIC